MIESRINEIITSLAKALQDRDYETFVSYFNNNAVFEIPFTINGGTILTGLSEITKHFEGVSQNPLTKLVQINEVSTNIHHSTDGKTATVEYFTEGKSLNTGESFKIQSSIALLEFDDLGIVYYKDMPNTLGIAKKAGVLPQLAASWSNL